MALAELGLSGLSTSFFGVCLARDDAVECLYGFGIDFSVGLGVVWRSKGDVSVLMVGILEWVIDLADFDSGSLVSDVWKELLISRASLFKSAAPSDIITEEGLLPLFLREETDPLLSTLHIGPRGVGEGVL